MNVNCIVTMGLVPEIKYLVSCILYLVSCILVLLQNLFVVVEIIPVEDVNLCNLANYCNH